MRRKGHLKFFQDGCGRHLGFFRTGNSVIRSAVSENPTLERNMQWIGSGSDDRLRRYANLKFLQDGGNRHLGFFELEIAPLISAVPENPTLEPNTEWIGRPFAEIWPFEIFPRWRQPPSWIFFEPEMAPLDPPSPKNVSKLAADFSSWK